MKRARPLILVADDDPGARLLQRVALESGGFDVETASDGQQALQFFSRVQPDCLVLDVVMPYYTGFEVCRAVRALAEGKHTPILILTSLDDARSISEAYDAGATDFTQKGLAPLLLLERVRFLLRAKALRDGLVASEARLAQAQRIARIGHWEYDADGNTISVSPVALDVLGVASLDAMTIDALRQRVHPDDAERFDHAYNEARNGHGRVSLDLRITTPTGQERIVHVESQSLREQTDRRHSSYVMTLQDISQLRHAEQVAHSLTYYDSLTNLPNRAFLQEQLTLQLYIAEGRGGQVAAITVDLEKLNSVNHTLGSTAGDELLRAVARRLQEHLAPELRVDGNSSAVIRNAPNTVARTGGDEFGIVMALHPNGEHIATILRRLLHLLHAPFQIAGQEITIGATLGAALFPDDAKDADALLRCADLALQQAKHSTRGDFQFYSAAMQSQVGRRLSLESELRRAIQRDQLQLHYQPRVLNGSLRPVAVEALMRWRHPDIGDITPSEFIPIAEDSGLIIELGEWALNKACEQASQWRNGARGLRIAVNVSAIQLQRVSVAEQVDRALRCYRLKADLLEIEITEGILIDQPALATRALESLKSHGIRIALDDFGTGYSSLKYLSALPIDDLKIDRTFVGDLDSGKHSEAIIDAILTLANGLQLRTIAEGVETDAQLKFLSQRHCDELQGFLFAKPMSAADLDQWLAGPAGPH